MHERPRMAQNWPFPDLLNGLTISKELQMCKTATEVVDWSIKNYSSLGLKSLYLSLSYVANNPGAAKRSNDGALLGYGFGTMMEADSTKIMSKIKVGDTVQTGPFDFELAPGGYYMPLSYQWPIEAIENGYIKLGKKADVSIFGVDTSTNQEGEKPFKPKNLKNNLFIRFEISQRSEVENICIQEQVSFASEEVKEMISLVHNIKVEKEEDIEEHRKELETILIGLDSSLKKEKTKK